MFYMVLMILYWSSDSWKHLKMYTTLKHVNIIALYKEREREREIYKNLYFVIYQNKSAMSDVKMDIIFKFVFHLVETTSCDII